jgi:hypothetical protein
METAGRWGGEKGKKKGQNVGTTSPFISTSRVKEGYRLSRMEVLRI